MIDLEGTSVTSEETELMRHPLVGGVILFTRNYADPEQLTQLVAAIHGQRSPPLIVAADHEGGRVQRFRQGFSRLPPARRIGHEFDQDARAGVELARRMGWLMAAALRAHGVDMSFAPCVDLDYGVSEVIGDRAVHSRPEAVGQLAAAYLPGMREAGAGAAAGYGDVVTRARQALTAGCDMLPVCNNRASVIALLEQLDVEPEPASRLRLVRLHGRESASRQELTAMPEWSRSQELLARCVA